MMMVMVLMMCVVVGFMCMMFECGVCLRMCLVGGLLRCGLCCCRC